MARIGWEHLLAIPVFLSGFQGAATGQRCKDYQRHGGAGWFGGDARARLDPTKTTRMTAFSIITSIMISYRLKPLDFVI